MGQLHVVAANLRAKAAVIQALSWPDFTLGDRLVPASGFAFSAVAAQNISRNHGGLARYLAVAKTERVRLAEALLSTAEAYEQVDLQTRAALDGDGLPAPAPVTPSAPPPGLPPPLPVSPPVPVTPDDTYRTPLQAQAMLAAGDQAVSLLEAAAAWTAGAVELNLGAQELRPLPPGWSGTAAEQADVRFGAFKAWLDDFALRWAELATEAAGLAQAHAAARAAHTGIAEQYATVEVARRQAVMLKDMPRANAYARAMQQLQEQSEEICRTYCLNSATDSVYPGEVPQISGNPTAVHAGEGPAPVYARHLNAPARADGATGGSGDTGGALGAAGPAAGPATPTPDPASALPQPVDAAPAPATPAGGTPASGTPASGTPAGPAPAAGSPTGAGLPAGSSVRPAAASPPTIPRLPDGPRLEPAAVSGGGGAGGGAGVAAAPLGPAVSAETVATVAARGLSSSAGAGASPAAGGIGMGGGIPMAGHGGIGQGGKEKGRSPALAADEEIYTEDRPWTEAIIGNRRRKDVQDGKESK